MKKVIIEKTFFDLDSPLSKGLISGLKKLSRRGFAIEVPDFDISSDDYLNKIFNLEGISINNLKEQPSQVFEIKTSCSKNITAVVVDKKHGINNFEEAVESLLTKLRTASVHRKTKETEIKIELSLDGSGESKIKTGIGFFDHMLEQIARHSNINMSINVKGDLNVDEHHTVEDVGIALGNALSKALGDKLGVKRYGYFLPMDDSIAQCAIDLGGRAYLNFKCKFTREKVGEFPTELTEEFFRGVASGLKANIFIRCKGKNEHHKIEAIFKAFAKSLNEACRFDERSEGKLPSTKGIL
jgi:imidazoleglycerol-phosphate dehydratase/histidinol-phosphatase